VAGNDGFLDHIPALIAAALGAVGTSIGLSYFGVAGTLAGLTVGTILTGAVAWWAERLIRRASARAKALAEARRRKGAPLSATETSLIQAVSDEQHKRRYRPPWQAVALGLASVFAVAGALLVVIALSAGRPVGAIVRPPAAVHTHTHTPPPSSPTPGPSRSSSTTFSTPPPSPSPSPSPDLTPDPSPSVATLSPSPSATPPAPGVLASVPAGTGSPAP
jgi:hypothetical protein